MAKFPDNYPIEMLQGGPRPGHARRMRVIASRIAWLCNKLQTFAGRMRDEAPSAGYLVDELATLAIVVEIIEDRFPMGAPQGFNLHELGILRTLVGERIALQLEGHHDHEYQTLMTKIEQLQAHKAKKED